MTRAAQKGFTNLEVLRFAAAFSVVVYHYQHFKGVPARLYKHVVDDQPWAPVLHVVYAHGHMAVQFFWILSGFIFFSQYLERIAAGSVSAGRFALLRFSRLYPLHIVTALYVFFAQFAYRSVSPDHRWYIYTANRPKDLLEHVFMASQWRATQTLTLNGPVWSVSLEVLAYASFFPIARWLRRPALVTACAPALLLYGTVTGAIIPTMFACFYLGGGVWQVQHAVSASGPRVKRWVAIAALAGTLTILVRVSGTLLHGRWGTPAFSLAMYGAFALAILGFALVPQLSGRSGDIAGVLGNLTYAGYLLHFPLQLTFAITAAILGVSVPWHSPALLVGYVLVVGVAALLTYRLFELPMQQRLREYGTRKWEVAR